MLLTLTLRVKVKQMKWRWGLCLIALIPGLGELESNRKCGSSEWKNSSPQMTDSMDKILGFYSKCINTWCEQSEWHNWIAGDGLHIPFICQLPLKRSLPAWHKIKHSQALPLKEGFRQVPAHITGQVFQTTWSQRDYTSVVKQPSKAKSSSREP